MSEQAFLNSDLPIIILHWKDNITRIKWTHSKKKFWSNKLEAHSHFSNKRSKDENIYEVLKASSTTNTIDQMQMKILKSDVVQWLGCLIVIQETLIQIPTMEFLWPNLSNKKS